MLVVPSRLDLFWTTGAMNRLKELLHHLSPPLLQALDAVLAGLTIQRPLMMMRVGSQLFPFLCSYIFVSWKSFFSIRLRLVCCQLKRSPFLTKKMGT